MIQVIKFLILLGAIQISYAKLSVGVLLMNLGGPDGRPNSVRGFLYNLFADPEIIRFPKCLQFLQTPVAHLISTFRSKKSSLAYKEISYEGIDVVEHEVVEPNSPINYFTKMQTSKLQEYLEANPDLSEYSFGVYYAMRYWHPYVNETLQRMKEDGRTHIVVIPLYPQYSISTTRSSLVSLMESIQQDHAHYWGNVLRTSHTVVPHWYHHPKYIDLLTQLIVEKVKEAVVERSTNETLRDCNRFSSGNALNVLFSAHGTPVSYVQIFQDPYQQQIEHTVLLVLERLCEQYLPSLDSFLRSYNTTLRCGAGTGVYSLDEIYSYQEMNRHNLSCSANELQLRVLLSYQSKVGPVEWLGPYTDQVVAYLGDHGASNLMVLPVSFVSDHIETLFEIDVEYRELAEHHGILQWIRVEVPNAHPLFIETLGDLVVDALRHKHNPTTAGTVYPVEHVLAREAAYGLSINQTLLLPYKSLGQEEPEHMGTKAALIVRNVWQQWCAGNQCGETVTKAMHHAISLLQDKVMVQRWVDKSTAAIGHLLGFFGVSYSLAKILMINWQIFYSAMLSLALSIMLG